MAQLVHEKAMQMIHNAILPLIQNGLKVEDLALHVSSHSEISKYRCLDTMYGELGIKINIYAPRGVSYIMENKLRGFVWVSKGVVH